VITPPGELFGLVLAGGRSARMGRDKALLTYGDGRPQAVVAYELLREFCRRVYLSVRTVQEALSEWPQLVDRYEEIGPMAGILTALDEHREAAWLVVACDLPFLNRETLRQLLAARDPQRIATAFRSAHDGLPEPLCAIYEPAARARLLEFVAQGLHCPRKALINSPVHLVELADHRALDNVNDPLEYERAATTPKL
jgi:molybdopterin-guanine dinucleotide biosynthesis protein A